MREERIEKHERIARLASTVVTIDDYGPEYQPLFGLLVGTIYCLAQAVEHGWEDGGVSFGDVDARKSVAETREVANWVAAGRLEQVPLVRGRRGGREFIGPWLAGFYFGSALHRIAMCADRIGIVPPGGRGGGVLETPAITVVRQQVNWYKHSQDVTEPRAKRVRWPDALDATDDLLRLGQQVGAFSISPNQSPGIPPESS